ncbi:MAG TPA: AlkA N-terminal domain-containing protein [Actinomycetota bacterium]|nr:AlkA N-terminal domain-containing protein [Actinomycetota bacterium]
MSVTTAAGIGPGVDGFEGWARAVESRDARFDGRVFVAVTSTGIYCRPVCPAPTPQRRHVRFFTQASAAEREGFRPCRRCRPGPRGDPLDRTHAELVEGALAIVQGAGTVSALARRLGVSTGHLRRAFATELGGTPGRVVRGARAGGRLSLALRSRAPFDAEGLLAFLRDRAIAGVEEVRGSTYRRSLSTSFGPVALSASPEEDRLRLEIAFEDVRSVPTAARAARSVFDLDADPSSIARTLERDPALRPLVRSHPGIRLPGAADGFEVAVRAIVGQQVSVAAARTVLGRIAARFGCPLDGRTVFPTAEALAGAPLEELGIVGRRAGAIRRVATMVARGELGLGGDGDPEETVGRLLEVDGIGPWTAEYIRMRALRDPDAFVAGDLGVRRAFERLGLDANTRTIVTRAEAWRPWRAYATMLLWRVA